MKNDKAKDILAIKAVLSGDKEAYGYIIDTYRPSLVFWLFKKVQDHDIAEDLASDIFAKAYQKLDKYKPTNKFSSWLYTLALNFYIDWSRKAEQQVKKHSSFLSEMEFYNNIDTLDGDDELIPEKQSLFDKLANTLVDDSNDIDKILSDTEKKKIIREAINYTGKSDKMLLSLCYEKEMTYQEIATKTCIKINTLKTRLMRAKLKVGEYILRYYPEFVIA